MTKTVAEYIADGDLEGYIQHIAGLNLVYRHQMLKALRSDENEMVKVGAVFAEVNNREVKEDIRLMSPAFRAGFLPLFIMNGGKVEQLSA